MKPLNGLLDDWMEICSHRGESLPAAARMVFEVWPGRDEIDVRVRIILEEEP